MKKKYYAVKKGKVPGIYETWNEAKAQVDGFSGAVYKSFSTLEEADKYIASQNSVEEDIFDSESLNQEVEKRIGELQEDEAIAFVDGSYDVELENSGFGAILISSGGSREFIISLLIREVVKNLLR
jgi:viroplasmin and RNaseH domain-containing protein